MLTIVPSIYWHVVSNILKIQHCIPGVLWNNSVYYMWAHQRYFAGWQESPDQGFHCPCHFICLFFSVACCKEVPFGRGTKMLFMLDVGKFFCTLTERGWDFSFVYISWKSISVKRRVTFMVRGALCAALFGGRGRPIRSPK